MVASAKLASQLYAPLSTRRKLGNYVRVTRKFVEAFKASESSGEKEDEEITRIRRDLMVCPLVPALLDTILLFDLRPIRTNCFISGLMTMPSGTFFPTRACFREHAFVLPPQLFFFLSPFQVSCYGCRSLQPLSMKSAGSKKVGLNGTLGTILHKPRSVPHSHRSGA